MDEVIEVLRDYEASCFTYLTENEVHTRQAIDISLAGNDKSGYPSIYDASYHALAIAENCQFITADRRHYEKTKSLGHVALLSELGL